MNGRQKPQEFTIDQQAWLDGRDLKAVPPLTVSKINLWEKLPREKITGQLKHGTQVKITEAQFNESERRWYYRVQHLFKSGWIPGVFLNQEKPEVLGDLV